MIAFITALAHLYLPEDLNDHRGQSLVEYALIIVLISIAVIVAVTALGGQLGAVFSRICTSLGGAAC